MSNLKDMKKQEDSWTVIIPKWQNSYQKSAKTAVKYWLWKDVNKLPKKYKDQCIAIPLTFGKKQFCTNNKGERFIKNPNKEGKPNLWIINGQDLYSAKMNWRLRKTVTQYFHEYFIKSIIDSLTHSITIPKDRYLSIKCDIYEIERGNMPDISNMWPLIKWFEDSLKICKVIPDDGPKYVRESGTLKYHFVESEKDRKLIFTIKLI